LHGDRVPNLRVKPSVDIGDKRRVIGGIVDLPASGNFAVMDVDVSRPGSNGLKAGASKVQL
jgi:hypothetical protein